MERGRVTDYFRQCKRQPTKEDDENIHFPQSSFDEIEKEPVSKGHLKSESTPKSKNSEATSKLKSELPDTSRSHKACKLKKQKADQCLLETPTSQSSDDNGNPKVVSQSVRKRLIPDDGPESTKPCKILKYESPEPTKTPTSRSDDNGNTKLVSQSVRKRLLRDNGLESTKPCKILKYESPEEVPVAKKYTALKEQNTSKSDERSIDKLVPTTISSGDIGHKLVFAHEVKGTISDNVADLSNENNSDIKQRNETETDEMKVPLTNCKNTKTFDTSQISIETPDNQKYHYFSSSPSSSLPLPYKYKSLEEIFQSADRTVSILHNRQEVCTFPKLKQAVQQMTRRTFNKTHLGQIKTVFPQAYELSVEKQLNTLSTNGSNGDSQLTIIPNFDYGNNENLVPGGIGRLHSQLQKNGIRGKKSEKSFVAMNSSCLSGRRSIFHHNLLEITKKHHEKFLESLNPPVHVPWDKICRWHPHFPLYSVPDIPPAPLPELLASKHYPTAKDVLKLVSDKVEDKVGTALQSVAEKHEKIQVIRQKPNIQELVKQGKLKGIPQALVEKVRAREAVRLQKIMTRQPDVEKRLEMISRFPELVSILRNYFITSQKVAIPIGDVSKKVADSYRSHLSSENAEQHLYLMANLLPEWISIITISKGPFVKLDKNKDVKIVIEKINQLIKQES